MRRGDRGSSKENLSDESDGPFVNEKRFGRNREVKRHGHYRRSSPSQGSSRGHRKGYMKPEKYDGSTCFEIFMTQFDNCAEFNRWTKSEKLAHLKWSLKGSAAQLLWGSHDLSYRGLVARLRSRFGSADLKERFQAELQCRKRMPNEPLRDLAQDIRRLMMLSYPGDRSRMSEHLAKECFISALEGPELELKVREHEPRTLDSALKIAMRLEVFSNAIRQRYRLARQASSSDEA